MTDIEEEGWADFCNEMWINCIKLESGIVSHNPLMSFKNEGRQCKTLVSDKSIRHYHEYSGKAVFNYGRVCGASLVCWLAACIIARPTCWPEASFADWTSFWSLTSNCHTNAVISALAAVRLLHPRLLWSSAHSQVSFVLCRNTGALNLFSGLASGEVVAAAYFTVA